MLLSENRLEQAAAFKISTAAAPPRLPRSRRAAPRCSTHIPSHTQRRGGGNAVPSSVLCRRAFATVSGHRHSPRHRGGGVASRREGCGNVSCDARRGLSLRAAHRSLRAGRPRRGRDPKSLPKPTAATARLPSHGETRGTRCCGQSWRSSGGRGPRAASLT